MDHKIHAVIPEPSMWQPCKAKYHTDIHQELWLMLTSKLRLGKKFDHGDMDVDARIADFLIFLIMATQFFLCSTYYGISVS